MTGARILTALACLGILLGSKADAQKVPSQQAVPMGMKTTAFPPSYSAPRPFYYLIRVQVANADPARFVWRLRTASADNAIVPPAPWTTYSSLSAPALRSWVSRLPRGSHMLSFFRFGAVPSGVDLKKAMSLSPSLQSEVDDFRRFCQSVGVDYGYVTSAG